MTVASTSSRSRSAVKGTLKHRQLDAALKSVESHIGRATPLYAADWLPYRIPSAGATVRWPAKQVGPEQERINDGYGIEAGTRGPDWAIVSMLSMGCLR